MSFKPRLQAIIFIRETEDQLATDVAEILACDALNDVTIDPKANQEDLLESFKKVDLALLNNALEEVLDSVEDDDGEEVECPDEETEEG